MSNDAEIEAKREAGIMLQREEKLRKHILKLDTMLSQYLMAYCNNNLLNEYKKVIANMIRFIGNAKHQARYSNPLVEVLHTEHIGKDDEYWFGLDDKNMEVVVYKVRMIDNEAYVQAFGDIGFVKYSHVIQHCTLMNQIKMPDHPLDYQPDDDGGDPSDQ